MPPQTATQTAQQCYVFNEKYFVLITVIRLKVLNPAGESCPILLEHKQQDHMLVLKLLLL